VLLYFRKDLATIIVAWLRSLFQPEYRGSHDARMGWYVIIGTIPVAVLGFAFRHQIKDQARDLRIIAAAMIGVALVLWVADRVGRREKELRALDVRDGFIYGLAQATALVPGVSRSGATISAGLFLGYTREAATRYSFLLSIPAVLASGLFELLDIGKDSGAQWGPTILATVIAGIVGYAVIAWLLRYVATHSFLPFVIYRLSVGLLLVVLLATGALAAR
jgi:undecaprenyl-diphosphatase